jgi:L-ascorbate metabolism protein UlaG (beta-lactamase superfamily)
MVSGYNNAYDEKRSIENRGGWLMKLTLIRNAAMIWEYGGARILTDPDFSPKHGRPSFSGGPGNPKAALPLTPEQILSGVEQMILSHLHRDHFDPVAREVIPKTLPVFCQPGDEDEIRAAGFENVTPIKAALDWRGIHITRVDGHHGLGQVETMMGKVSGFVLQADNEPTVYWAGDTVLCEEVRDAIADFQPDVIITHSSGATWADDVGDPALIVMDAAQTVQVCQLAPNSKIIPIHMDSLDHGTVSRSDLAERAREAGVDAARLIIPQDGQTIEL